MSVSLYFCTSVLLYYFTSLLLYLSTACDAKNLWSIRKVSRNSLSGVHILSAVRRKSWSSWIIENLDYRTYRHKKWTDGSIYGRYLRKTHLTYMNSACNSLTRCHQYDDRSCLCSIMRYASTRHNLTETNQAFQARKISSNRCGKYDETSNKI